MFNYFQMFTDTIFGFIALFTLTKVLGKTQISQITTFDFISSLLLGELVGNGLFDPEVGILQVGFVVLLWGGLMYITEIITQKYKLPVHSLKAARQLLFTMGN